MTTEFRNPERAKRMAELIDDLPREELIRTTLQAIDHALASAAEAEAQMFPIHDLRHRNESLEAEVSELQDQIDGILASRSYRLGRLLTAPARAIRRAMR